MVCRGEAGFFEPLLSESEPVVFAGMFNAGARTFPDERSVFPSLGELPGVFFPANERLGGSADLPSLNWLEAPFGVSSFAGFFTSAPDPCCGVSGSRPGALVLSSLLMANSLPGLFFVAIPRPDVSLFDGGSWVLGAELFPSLNDPPVGGEVDPVVCAGVPPPGGVPGLNDLDGGMDALASNFCPLFLEIGEYFPSSVTDARLGGIAALDDLTSPMVT